MAFLLAFCRIGAALAVAPAFGRKEIPARVKVVAAAAIAFFVAPMNLTRAAEVSGPLAVAVVAAAEVMVGLLFGFAAQLFFCAIRMAGEFLGRQMGLAMASLIDPGTGQPTTILGEFMATIGLLVFVAADAHLVLVALLVRSCSHAPPSTGTLVAAVPRLSGRLDQAFGAALSLAAPVLVVSFMVSVVLALLARAAPQANILLVGMPLKLGAGLIAIAFFVPVMGWCLVRLVSRMGPEMQAFLLGG
jgi:flagellar biosynthetic protein FliR